MAQLSIIGLQGSGKSHQAVKGIIVPNYILGRRILTNIKGFNIEELDKYCINILKKKKEDLGQIVIINDKDIRLTGSYNLKDLQNVDINDPLNAPKLKSFYPYLLDVNNQEVIVDQFSTVKSGDVVVIDEAGSFYKKVSEYDMEFFRMHRHFTNNDGIACELVFMFQTKAMVHRDFFALMFQVYQCKKLSFIGLDNAYSLRIYDGSSLREDTIINRAKAFYDKNIFPIYSSYAKGKGKEQKLDKRGALLSNPKFWLFIVFSIFSIFFLIYAFNSFFKPQAVKTDNVAVVPQSSNNLSQSAQSSNFNSNSNNSNFSIVGVLDYPRKRLVILQDENNNFKMIIPELCTGKGFEMTCKIDNKEISYYSNKVKNNNSFVGGQNENKNNNNNSTNNNR